MHSLIPPKNPRNRDPYMVCLGRHGDLINVLPMAWKLSQIHGHPIKWVVNREFAGTLEGCSYVEPIPVDAHYSKANAAVSIVKSGGMHGEAIIAQSYGTVMERRRKQKSYQLESWDVANRVHEFGYWPTVFDKRDAAREASLLSILSGKPLVIVATSAVSSPIPHLSGLAQEIATALGDKFQVLDASEAKADRIYDMLALLDVAKLLVTVDSGLLHLARGSKCPVLAITNEKWFGSVSPPNTILEFKYGKAYPKAITEAVAALLIDSKPKATILHAVDGFKPTERHLNAFEANKKRDIVRIESNEYIRDARNLGHDRPLPYLKDILKPAMMIAKDSDIILWTNSDIELLEGIEDWCRDHVGAFGAAVMRRDIRHCGVDTWGMTGEWLRAHWEEIPDYLIGAPVFDLGIRAMVRKYYGINSQMGTMTHNIFPADSGELLTFHQDHDSEWNNDSPASVHNGREFSRWIKEYGKGMIWRQ